MSRRGRAIGFASAAAICAGVAAGATSAPSGGSTDAYGELREVVVARATLPPRRPIGRRAADEALELRRVPASFVPPDALTDPAQAVGRRPRTSIPAGGYVLGSQLASASSRPRERTGPRLAGDRRPVEITVEGGGALDAGGGRVDVVVTTEARTGGAGRTYVAASTVRLLGLRAAGAADANAPLSVAADGSWVATLALTRAQALKLIHAQAFARDLRLIGA